MTPTDRRESNGVEVSDGAPTLGALDEGDELEREPEIRGHGEGAILERDTAHGLPRIIVTRASVTT